MKYDKKLHRVFDAVDGKTIPFPDSLKKKRINYLSIINVVALIRSVRKKDKDGSALLLAKEKAVKKLLNVHSAKECAYFISSIPKK